MSEPDYTKFLEELTELSKKHGVEISGCGCCGSPSLDPLGNKNGHYEYGDRYPGYKLTWIEDIASVSEPEHTCQFCGMPSYVDPSDQLIPPDYCHHDAPSQ